MVVQNIEVVTAGFASIYLLCYFSEVIDGHMQAIAEVIYTDSGWFDQSPKLRRHLLMIMRASQQPKFLSAFGLMVMTCSMENFTNVSDRAASISRLEDLNGCSSFSFSVSECCLNLLGGSSVSNSVRRAWVLKEIHKCTDDPLNFRTESVI